MFLVSINAYELFDFFICGIHQHIWYPILFTDLIFQMLIMVEGDEGESVVVNILGYVS